MTNMKLQKMLYYQQGFHLAYFGTPLLFNEDIEAWMYGSVAPSVYNNYKENGKGGIIPNKEKKRLNLSLKKEEALFNEVFRVLLSILLLSPKMII